jgi:hypothetical protein
MGTMSFAGLIGALVFLVIGVVELALLNRSLYPALRWRHEKAKLTQEQGIDPNRIMLLVKIQSLVLMPLLGLFLGDRMKSIFG